MKELDIYKQIVNLIKETQTSEDMPIMIGTLNKVSGVIGFKRAEIGHPVFSYKDRYIIYLESNNEMKIGNEMKLFTVAIPYYKESLSPSINFL